MRGHYIQFVCYQLDTLSFRPFAPVAFVFDIVFTQLFQIQKKSHQIWPPKASPTTNSWGHLYERLVALNKPRSFALHRVFECRLEENQGGAAIVDATDFPCPHGGIRLCFGAGKLAHRHGAKRDRRKK